MSRYYKLKEEAGLEALADMRVDTISGILNFANQIIDEVDKDIENCNISSIAHNSFRISQQIEYAREVSHENIRTVPPSMMEKSNAEITDTESRFLKMSNQINKKCKCYKK